MALIINILAALGYLGLAAYFANRLKHPSRQLPSWSKFLPIIPMALHLYSLYLAIETGHGQDLSLFNLMSLTLFIVTLLIAIYRIRHQAPHLMLYTAILSALALLISLIPHQQVILNLGGDSLGIWHIWLAIISFSLLLAATLQSLFVLVLDHKLRTQPAKIHPLLPPLLQMERLIFDLVLVGVVGLGIALILGFFLPEAIIQEQPLHKIILTVLAWFSFCTLIIGYKTSKISGIQFARFNLMAFGLLALGFIGSKLVIEFILARG